MPAREYGLGLIASMTLVELTLPLRKSDLFTASPARTITEWSVAAALVPYFFETRNLLILLRICFSKVPGCSGHYFLFDPVGAHEDWAGKPVKMIACKKEAIIDIKPMWRVQEISGAQSAIKMNAEHPSWTIALTTLANFGGKQWVLSLWIRSIKMGMALNRTPDYSPASVKALKSISPRSTRSTSSIPLLWGTAYRRSGPTPKDEHTWSKSAF